MFQLKQSGLTYSMEGSYIITLHTALLSCRIDCFTHDQRERRGLYPLERLIGIFLHPQIPGQQSTSK